ncbi:MAG: MaoC family dehydratase N-terminal domain-containing protein [Dehalococcoidales bacterium]|nr:MaoC family dehydratase N-terminal domain-containing protein [Dehalococcoidales bacterium]
MLEEYITEIDEKKWENHPRVRIKKESTGEKAPSESGKVTPEMLERRKFRMNKPFIPSSIYFNNEATADTIRHYVDGIGDTNPLFRDAEYAGNTKYGRIVAPGTFLFTHQWTATGSGLTGIHGWYSGGDWEWYQPIYEGTKLSSVAIIRDMTVKEGRMAGKGNIYIDYGDVVYLNAETKEILGKELYHIVWAERSAAGSAKKERGREKQAYTKQDWIEILEAYDTEEVRGSRPRYWEDVQVGDVVGPLIKGPLSVRDELVFLMGAGSPYLKAHKNEFNYEARHPSFLEHVAETGEDDAPELVHYLDQFARAIGVERAYDYGNQRMSWMCNLFTNWAGDDGFLWKMSGDERAFNMMGDTTILEGKVVKKYTEGNRYCVDIESWAKNQRGETTMPPNISSVILPSRDKGPVTYPEPSPQLVDEVNRARPLRELIGEGLI